jgi:hypothetical protein
MRHTLARTSLSYTQHHTDGHMAHNATANNTFYITNNRTRGRHYSLLCSQQHLTFATYFHHINYLVLIYIIIVSPFMILSLVRVTIDGVWIGEYIY